MIVLETEDFDENSENWWTLLRGKVIENQAIHYSFTWYIGLTNFLSSFQLE